jgi:hypothetical protein
MATSGNYTVTVTALSLMKNSYLNIGAHALGQELSGEKTALAIEGLNAIIKLWEGPPNFIQRGMKMWQRETGSLTMTAKNNFSLKPSGGDCDIQIPLEILSAILRHTSSSSDTVLEPINLDQYQEISNKSATGTPLKYYYEKRIDEGKLYLDIVPSASVISGYTISFVYRQPLEIISAAANEFDIESSYRVALEFALSRWLAPKMGRAISNEIEAQYVEALALMSTFQPDFTDGYYEKDRDD